MSTLKVDTLQHRDGTEYILSERNKVINGDFSVAQRGTSFTSTDSDNNDAKYTLDRWQLFSDGNDVVDVTQETTTVPTNQLYAIALDVETANKKFGIAQKIEQKNCVDLIGNEVTLSFKAKVSSTTNLDNVKCAIIAWDGTADTLTDDMISAWGSEGTDPTLATNYTYENTPANLNLTTSYATYTTTATIDTSGAKNVVVFIWSDVTTTSTGEFLYITDVQLEKGPSNSIFERKSFGRQLADCQRYYETSANYGSDVTTETTAYHESVDWLVGTYHATEGVNYKVNKRSDPTVTIYNPQNSATSGQAYQVNASNGGTNLAASTRLNKETFFNIAYGTSGRTAGYSRFNWSSDAEL
jgi:hypothetical protein